MSQAARTLRRALRVRGTVQGVGFRPAMYRLAVSLGLAGIVRNDGDGVWIEIEGDALSVERFAASIRAGAPPLAQIASVEVRDLTATGERGFHVIASAASRGATALIPADVATCDACLTELFDPVSRRFRYPFINCTDCGPRYTIVRDVPYDRARTTMHAFELCLACREEYENPSSRRFHAEPNACAACGPRLTLQDHGGNRFHGEDALAAAMRTLRSGKIVAVKGLGGFFLAVDARDDAAVARLRQRKRRPHRPFALLCRDVNAALDIVELSSASLSMLGSPARPVVLARARSNSGIAPSVAPRLAEYGVMLPSTPLHHLMAESMPVMVMTSGNVAEEPIAKDDARALKTLSAIADAFLLHDREIHARADDSVFRELAERVQPVRRARGFVPAPIELPFESPPVLAVGAELKNTVTLARGRQAFLSPHIGDLQGLDTFEFFKDVISSFEALLDIRPDFVAHDLHPDYASTRWALQSGLACIGVQHHHAHLASCLVENGRTGPVIGVVFDGTGCGPDGELWGGEVLLADLVGFERLGHLWPIALPGGEAAIREPWRLGCAALLDAGLSPDHLIDATTEQLRCIQALMASDTACPRSTGAGRWFDAVAAICGGPARISYEGQAAVELESLCTASAVTPFPFDVVSPGGVMRFDLRPTVRAIAEAREREEAVGGIAARFHETLAGVVREACVRARQAQALECVALSGGCFQNRVLSDRCVELLESEGFEVLVHRRVPPNDGGVSLGQAAIAAARLQRKEPVHVSGNPR